MKRPLELICVKNYIKGMINTVISQLYPPRELLASIYHIGNSMINSKMFNN